MNIIKKFAAVVLCLVGSVLLVGMVPGIIKVVQMFLSGDLAHGLSMAVAHCILLVVCLVIFNMGNRLWKKPDAIRKFV